MPKHTQPNKHIPTTRRGNTKMQHKPIQRRINMKCCSCKEDQNNLAVCDGYITWIHEDCQEYECIACFSKRENIELHEERATRRVLERILTEGLKNR